MSIHLEQWKWSKKDRVSLYRSVKDILGMEHSQMYYPIMSLYFYIHNKPKAIHKIDMKRILKKEGAVVGLADGILDADGKIIYRAENLKVGLFK